MVQEIEKRTGYDWIVITRETSTKEMVSGIVFGVMSLDLLAKQAIDDLGLNNVDEIWEIIYTARADIDKKDITEALEMQ